MTLYRPPLLSFIVVMLLAGCAFPDDMARDPTAPRALLQPWTDLTGGQIATSLGVPSAEHVMLRNPAAMSARGNDVYLIDTGLRRIFRYDRNLQTLTPFAPRLSVEIGMGIYAAPDRSVYIINPTRGEVSHFTWDGTPLPSLVSRGNLARPVSVAVDENTGQVLVADALFDQIITFNSLGMTLSVTKPQQVLAITAMAAGSDGLYVIDHLARRVVALDWNGNFRYAFADDMGEPGNIAVSRDNLVFVSDNFNHVVKIYRDGQLVTQIGGQGLAEGSFNGIAGLAVDEDMLYVADSLNARVQIMLINPEQRTNKVQKTAP